MEKKCQKIICWVPKKIVSEKCSVVSVNVAVEQHFDGPLGAKVWDSIGTSRSQRTSIVQRRRVLFENCLPDYLIALPSELSSLSSLENADENKEKINKIHVEHKAKISVSQIVVELSGAPPAACIYASLSMGDLCSELSEIPAINSSTSTYSFTYSCDLDDAKCCLQIPEGTHDYIRLRIMANMDENNASTETQGFKAQTMRDAVEENLWRVLAVDSSELVTRRVRRRRVKRPRPVSRIELCVLESSSPVRIERYF